MEIVWNYGEIKVSINITFLNDDYISPYVVNDENQWHTHIGGDGGISLYVCNDENQWHIHIGDVQDTMTENPFLVSDKIFNMIVKGGSQKIVKTGNSYYVNIPKFLMKNAFWEPDDLINIKFIQEKGIFIIYNPSAHKRIKDFYDRLEGHE